MSYCVLELRNRGKAQNRWLPRSGPQLRQIGAAAIEPALLVSDRCTQLASKSSGADIVHYNVTQYKGTSRAFCAAEVKSNLKEAMPDFVKCSEMQLKGPKMT